ncbi:ABC transporter, ATP-binding protein [Lactobacillus sp. wkB8]|uniref:ATP-binding cassette domain-containing protein n=1 Tax=Lactobacillus sp. wkB8 TaxID=1545702 RepID=UPI00050D2AD8|nr:ATP-binding cassette domain-containing protein [Lactobacillus sp. wkB8]AIS10027.1 ABC transporter, ATP-binding protein [Lactobacillus sp. wkB8]
MEYIRITNLNVENRDESLFYAPHLNIQDNQIIGLIGDNGVGKTTLINIIAQVSTIFRVTGQIQRHCRIVLVPQLLNNDEQSGGEKEKEVITQAIIKLGQARNFLLILDEPTSNLDIEQQRWLIKTLSTLSQPILIISHDQSFLQKLVNVIWHIKDHQVHEFKGSYSEYCRFLTAEEKRKNIEYHEKLTKIKKLKKDQRDAEIKSQKATKKKKDMSWSDWKIKDSGKIEKRLSRISTQLKKRITSEEALLGKPQVHHTITLSNVKTTNLDLSQKSSLVRLGIQDVVLHGNNLFSITKELQIKGGEKIALTGKNGVGKSVFLAKLFHQKLNAWFNPQLKIGYVKQNIAQEAAERETVIETISKISVFDKTTTMQLLGDLHLRRFLNNQVCDLSGGQLVCYKLAKVLLGEHNLLILDEPDNFLDISAINALETFLKNYPFAIILVSHDQNLLKNLNFAIWEIKNHNLITASDFSSHKNTNIDNRINLLQFKLDKLITDPNASFKEIENISREINNLKHKISKEN